ncbi:SAM-dependent methyltransferase [Streptomyces hygroscopicus]|uniref:SAM-dependent methyltransferase n=1 Tax=Streptomyces hygroscopicus TaxID=1912 RepID=UPI001FCC33E0|nr:SAM-dependent methyltransferase [Streptomyces hygroscopicus]BDH10520.1 hypothetical protein HOK021_16990 [Streptomyces hygroscopicus]
MRTLLPDNWASTPTESRVNDYLLGGEDNFAVDRELGDRLVRTVDWLPRAAQITRMYGALTAAHLARRGIHQFMDLGCGYPSPSFSEISNVHLAAEQVMPNAKVVHIDHDPVVVSQAQVHLVGPRGEHSIVCADIRKTEDVLATPEVTALDRDQPVGVLLHDVLPWITDDGEVHELLAKLRDWLPAGSAISITHATADMRPHEVEDLVDIYEKSGLAFCPRSASEIGALHEPWPLEEPGLLPTGRWHKGSLHAYLPDAQSGAYAALSLHPDQDRSRHAR